MRGREIGKQPAFVLIFYFQICDLFSSTSDADEPIEIWPRQ